MKIHLKWESERLWEEGRRRQSDRKKVGLDLLKSGFFIFLIDLQGFFVNYVDKERGHDF